MTWRRTTCLLLLVPRLVAAQGLSGVTEWTVSRGADTTGGQTSVNNAFWQNYSLGFSSFVLDPRLMKYDAAVSFRTNSLTFGSEREARQGGQRGLGYNLSAALFPARPFPLSVQMTRNNISESGAFPTSNMIRGGIVVPAGESSPDFQTRNSSVSVNWQLKAEGLPKVDVGYRTNNAVLTGSGQSVEQRDGDLHATISKDTSAIRQTLRYQRTAFEHLLAQSFNQHFNELGYDLDVLLGRRSRLTAHAGRRNAFSLLDTPPQIVDAGTGIAPPSTQGQSDTMYATSGITLEPNGRVSLGLTGSLDEQRSGAVTTTSKLLTSTARLEPFTGLSLNASGNYGLRGQVVGDVPLDVITRSVQAGASYRAGVRWLEASVAGSRRIGENTADDGRMARVQSWSGDGTVSLSIGAFSANGGYDRTHGEDALLDFGNFDIRRRRATVQVTRSRAQITAAWDRTMSDRGRTITFNRAWQDTFSATASARLGESVLSGSAGGFDSRATSGRDRTYFAGGSLESHVGKIRLSAVLRQELTSASATHLEQWSLVGFIKAEYTRRLFGFGAEFRRNAQHLQFSQIDRASDFRGRQFNVRILRKFGARR